MCAVLWGEAAINSKSGCRILGVTTSHNLVRCEEEKMRKVSGLGSSE